MLKKNVVHVLAAVFLMITFAAGQHCTESELGHERCHRNTERQGPVQVVVSVETSIESSLVADSLALRDSANDAS